MDKVGIIDLLEMELKPWVKRNLSGFTMTKEQDGFDDHFLQLNSMFDKDINGQWVDIDMDIHIKEDAGNISVGIEFMADDYMRAYFVDDYQIKSPDKEIKRYHNKSQK